MTRPKSDFVATLQDRGFIHQMTDAAGLDERCSKGSWSPISASTAPPTACMSAT